MIVLLPSVPVSSKKYIERRGLANMEFILTSQLLSDIMTVEIDDADPTSLKSLVQKCFHIQEAHEAFHHIISPWNL